MPVEDNGAERDETLQLLKSLMIMKYILKLCIIRCHEVGQLNIDNDRGQTDRGVMERLATIMSQDQISSNFWHS